MNDKELFAHYKKTAPVEDLKFFLRANMSAALRAEAEAQLAKPSRKGNALLRDKWRTERCRADEAARTALEEFRSEQGQE